MSRFRFDSRISFSKQPWHILAIALAYLQHDYLNMESTLASSTGSMGILFLLNPIGSFQKRSIIPSRRKFLPSGGRGEKKLFLIVIIVNVLGHPKGVRGLTFYFLCGGGMDVFWNDPLNHVGDYYTFIYPFYYY